MADEARRSKRWFSNGRISPNCLHLSGTFALSAAVFQYCQSVQRCHWFRPPL